MTCEQLMQMMVDNFEPSKAEGVDATIQFDLTGADACLFWLKITAGTIEAGQGSTDNPRMTLKSSFDDFTSVLKGEMPPMTAFIQGKIKIQGDTFLAMKLQSLLS